MKSIAKRVFLFFLLNAAIILTISAILSVFDIRPYLTKAGLDYEALLIFLVSWQNGWLV
jgi:hypothetical protein